ncbi:ferredoxin [Patescibacteria group bacterium]|nr:ferredoxin [Patescibacteria group bacterium]MBU1890268.1 ferredoxin [Patescibacteria group bacterium]
MKITIKKDACISAATCVAIAPGVFQLDDEGKAYIVDKKGADEKTIIEAAKSCPTQCITIKDDKGKQIYPEAKKK